MSLATVASVVGIVGGGLGIANSLHHGSGGSGAGQTVYTPTGSGTADQTWQNILQQLTGGSTGAANEINPAILSAFRNLMNVPTSGLTDVGNRAGAYYGNLASSQDLMQQALAAQGNQAGQAGRQLWNTALDPENALRNRLYTQTQDASRAGTSARGIGMGAEAAGIENQDLSNFMMNWQDRQLGRQSTGLQGMMGAFGQAGQDYTGASNLGTSAAGNILQSGVTPYQMNTMAAGAPFGYANQFNQAQGGTNQNLSAIMSQIIPYLYAGQGAAGQNFAQGQFGLNNLTSGLGALQRSPFLQNVFSQPQQQQQQPFPSDYGQYVPSATDLTGNFGGGPAGP